MQILNQQVGAVNFEPLKPKFLQIYQASRTFLPANPGMPPLEIYIRDQGKKGSLPNLPWDYEKIKSIEMKEAFKLVTKGKLKDAITAMRGILHTLLLYSASSKTEADEVVATVETLREYIIGFSIEIARRGVDVSTPEGVKRNLELAAYFTNARLRPEHMTLALQTAMMQFTKHQNIATAAVFAKKLIELGEAVEKVILDLNLF
jgi:coatomer subunit alpha